MFGCPLVDEGLNFAKVHFLLTIKTFHFSTSLQIVQLLCRPPLPTHLSLPPSLPHPQLLQRLLSQSRWQMVEKVVVVMSGSAVMVHLTSHPSRSACHRGLRDVGICGDGTCAGVACIQAVIAFALVAPALLRSGCA